MPLTTKERQRRFRERMKTDPERLETFRENERKRYHNNKARGIIRLIDERSSRGQRNQRRRWRVAKQKERQKQNSMDIHLTPPASPLQEQIPQPPTQSRQAQQSRKERNRKKAKCYRDKDILEKKLEASERKVEMYRKRLRRMNIPTNVDSPRSKTKKLLRHFSQNRNKHCKVKKTLNFHFALLRQMREKYAKTSQKRHINNAILGGVIRKYKLVSEVRRNIGVRSHVRKQKKNSKSVNLKNAVHTFLERDDNTRMSTGMKQTVTRNKQKRQKRFMLDTLQNLFKKFKAESNEIISFTTFWRLKPFWIKCPTDKERETCLCKTCENLSFMVRELFRNNVITTSNIDALVEQVVCSTDSQNCMFGNCEMCKEKQVETKDFDQNKQVTWTQWVTEKEKRELKNGEIKEVTITKRKEEEITLGDLLDRVHDELWLKFKRHSFLISNQMNHYKNVKQTLTPRECLVHVDFAENFIGKMAREIQSKHFGASQVQISLHTGYFITGSMESIKSFCGVSDSLQHDPISVWTFLKPILMHMKTEHPEVDTLHFYSDGPSSQYKQKLNFYLFSTEIFELGFQRATWNFHAAGHGKGIPDGIGAAVKRSADLKVKHGTDIVSAADLCKSIQESNSSIEIYLIKDEDILKVDKKVEHVSLKTIPGTMKIHQLFTENPGTVKFRAVSCDCSDKVCNGHDLQTFSFLEDTVKENKESKPIPMNKDVDISFEMESITDIRRREGKFRRYLKTFQTCETFDELKERCLEIHNQVDKVNGVPPNPQHYTVDQMSLAHLPYEFASKGDIPVKVRADGDCLPASGSVFVFGSDKHPLEMRVRIIVEQVLNEEFYLNENNLLKGYERHNFKTGTLIKGYTLYSDEYMHDRYITEKVRKETYEREVLKITKEKTFMGIWQIHSLSSVIGMPVTSIYPERGNMSVRNHLNRQIYPRTECLSFQAQIMWTSTRTDMNNNNWVPNHFVPVLSKETSDLIKNENVKIKDAYKDFLKLRAQECGNPEVTVDSCMGNYVLVCYFDKAYPGIVENVDAESQMVMVECMHRVGTNNDNCFSWPRKVRDRNWYDLDDILRVIPPLEAVKGADFHFKVNDEAWRAVPELLQKRNIA